MKHLLKYIVAATLLGGAGVQTAAAAECEGNTLVGAWEVQAQGAPYEPHLFIFHADGTMITTNPTNVQENPARPHGGTNDSLGMGTWTCTTGKMPEIIGTFYQLNANADDHKPTDKLSVTFKIKATQDAFTGVAAVRVGETAVPDATLIGKRIATDTAALGTL
ncbi:hypothetical protein MAUB1S_07761 [Mycolicibacterium aubagnense]